MRPIAVPTLVATLLTAALGLTGCSGERGTTAAPRAAAEDPADAGTSGSTHRAVSLVGGPLTVRESPSASAPVAARLAATTPLGSPRVLLAERVTSGWVRVDLPTRPHGTSGWVARDDVRLEPVSGRLEIDLRTRSLTYLRDGRVVTRARVAVGSPDNPTPVGRFYVTDRVRPARSGGPYGSFSLGLSVHSETLTEFGGGDGQIGIHGTDDPGSIGRAVSHGCVRVPREAEAVLRGIPLGTPVIVA